MARRCFETKGRRNIIIIRTVKKMKNILEFSKNYIIVWILLFLIILFSRIGEDFYSLNNFLNILGQSVIYGIMSIGMTILMINGYFDLSVGMVMCLSANLAISLQPFGDFVAVFCALLSGLLIGLINGVLTVKVKLNAFVVTLASMTGVRGLIYIYTKENALAGTSSFFTELSESKFLGIPTTVWIFIILLLVGEFILRRTVHGRNTYATGGNEIAARNAGINTGKTTLYNFVICSFMAALGGVFQAVRLNASTPTLGWPDLQMTIITCVVLGGTKLSGGYGNMFRTLGGVLVITVIQNAMNMMNVHSYYQTLLMGLILIAILVVDKYLKPVPVVKKTRNKVLSKII